MYEKITTGHSPARKNAFRLSLASLVCGALWFGPVSVASAETLPHAPGVVRKISELSEKLELTTNSSRILTLDKKIPRVQVNNPELLAVTPLSATQVQVSAKKAGVTQVNLWDEDGAIHTVDVLIYGDMRELTHALQIQFPQSAIRVYRYSTSLVLKGFVDNPDHVGPIIRLAENYAPKDELINNIMVGGVHQVLLKVRVMEVSRTKLRRLGVDWAHVSGSGVISATSVSGLIGEVAQSPGSIAAITPGVPPPPLGVVDTLGTFQFGIVNGSDAFFGFIDALQQNRVAKILAEPNIVAVSGRTAKFVSGGEQAIPVPGGVGQAPSIEFKQFGTIIDFVPIVLGNGNIRLEVRPEVSTPDPTLGTSISGTDVPGFRKRLVDTAVEMKAGQTFALAGLVEERVDTVNRGLPYLSDLPYIGVPFRRMSDEVEEIELLIMVTPEFIDPMDPHEVPCGGPGLDTVTPSCHDFYVKGHIEVPAHCNPIRGIHSCGTEADVYASGHAGGVVGPHYAAPMHEGPTWEGPVGGPSHDGLILPGGSGYDYEPQENSVVVESAPSLGPANSSGSGSAEDAVHGELRLPPAEDLGPPPASPEPPPSGSEGDSTGGPTTRRSFPPGRGPQFTTARPYSPQREPQYQRNTAMPQNQTPAAGSDGAETVELGLIGPIGYDVR